MPRKAGFKAVFFAAVLSACAVLSGCLGRQSPALAVSYGQRGADSAFVYSAPPGKTLQTVSQRYGLPPQQAVNLHPKISPPQKIVNAQAMRRPPPLKLASVKKENLPPHASSKFIWPVDGPVISAYGPRKGGLHNDGINIRAPRGAPVRAADDGTVVYAGSGVKGYGKLVLLGHGDRWVTAYAHMERLLVKKGQTVKQGDSIGTVGSSGSVSSPQLHFETRRGTDAINPATRLAQRGI